jgi:hypothetical protein
MSLGPGEQRALAGIENVLRRSDPRLAAMLTTFVPPLNVRLTVCLARAFRRRAVKCLALALVLPVVCLTAITALMISQPARLGCPPGMRASSPGQVGGFCGRAGGSVFRPTSRTAGSTRRPGAQVAAIPPAARRLAQDTFGAPPAGECGGIWGSGGRCLTPAVLAS